mmetsp:Transcript_15614/g.39812  ORF Transcript_15614/g.39812 Transcript_15614/m.39812 type:complete len:188 (-) Transcript_15614:18-581(-)
MVACRLHVPSTRGVSSAASPQVKKSVTSATLFIKPVSKTRASKSTKSIAIDNPNEQRFRSKQSVTQDSPKILTRIQELRLLSKAEEAGLLSAAERAGLTLSTIERLGLLSKAESLGVISAAADRKTPGSLLLLCLVLFAVGPAAVYFIPEDTTTLVVAQWAIAAAAAAGGAAAFGTYSLLSNLQSRR